MFWKKKSFFSGATQLDRRESWKWQDFCVGRTNIWLREKNSLGEKCKINKNTRSHSFKAYGELWLFSSNVWSFLLLSRLLWCFFVALDMLLQASCSLKEKKKRGKNSTKELHSHININMQTFMRINKVSIFLHLLINL